MRQLYQRTYRLSIDGISLDVTRDAKNNMEAGKIDQV